MNTRKIVEKVDRKHFKELIEERKDDVKVSPHAFDHLSHAQRERFTEKDLKRPLLRKVPNFVGLQENGRYAAYYKQKENYLKLIVEIKDKKVVVVTFMNKDILPRL